MKSTPTAPATPAVTLLRNEYGALNPSQVLSPLQMQQLKNLLEKAVDGGTVPDTYITSDKKGYECMNHDVFDVLIFRGKVKACVLQARYFWKDTRKGYTRSQKTYFLITKVGKKVEITTLEGGTCAKRAKNTTALGQLTDHYLGKKVVACKPLGKVAINTGYKVLAKTECGQLVSAYDESEYIPGTWRIEAVKPNHGGGFYFYNDKQHAVAATQRGETFASCVSDGKRLVLCAVEYKGKQIAYKNKKFSTTGIRIIEELELVTLHNDE